MASHRFPAVRTAVAAVIVAAVSVALLPEAGQAAPKPTIAQVQAELAVLNNEAEVAQEKLNQTQLDVVAAQRTLGVAKARVAASQARLAQARGSVGQIASAMYRGGGMDASLQLFLADSPTQYLEQMSALAGVSSRESNILRIAATAKLRLDSDQRAMTQQLGVVRGLRDSAAADYAQVQAAQASETALLNSLEASQRAALAAAAERARQLAIQRARAALAAEAAQAAAQAAATARANAAAAAAAAAAAHRRKTVKAPVSPAKPPARHKPVRAPVSSGGVGGGGGGGGIGARVVAYALSKVGDAYVWGAAGPSAYDCSGLTMRAYQQVGISLPHSSSAQWSSGRRISVGNLQPGDLVFYYSPVHHVGIYIGGGMIVNAENPGVGVTITGLYSMPYDGAVRPY
jgi:peptidoglycan DL-endopeptidase CwlO